MILCEKWNELAAYQARLATTLVEEVEEAVGTLVKSTRGCEWAGRLRCADWWLFRRERELY